MLNEVTLDGKVLQIDLISVTIQKKRSSQKTQKGTENIAKKDIAFVMVCYIMMIVISLDKDH